MRAASLLLILASCALPAHAAVKPAPAPAKDLICVTVRRLWAGTREETRDIHETPVPDSFRRLYAWTGCQTLGKETLIDWHLAFGDEATTTAALSFLEQTAMAGQLSPAQFQKALPRVWAAAQADAAKAQASFDKRDWDGGRRVFDASKSIARLRTFAAAYQRYLFLAAEYQRSAEFFGSAPLAAKAHAYLAPLMTALTVLYDDAPVTLMKEEPQLFNRLGLSLHDINRIRNLSLRASVMDARLKPDAATLAATEKLLDAYSDTIPLKAADLAYDGSDDFCAKGLSATPEFTTACHDENGFAERVARYWTVRAKFDMLEAGPAASQSWMNLDGPNESYQNASRLVAKGRANYAGEPPRYDATTDTLVALRIAKADMEAAQARLIDGQGSSPSNDDAQNLRSEALNDLSRAASMAAPDVHPGRFRQIARRYLAIDAEQAAHRDADAVSSATGERAASYFRVNLDALDRISNAE